MRHPKIQPGSTPLVRHEMEFIPASQIMQVPAKIRALFALFNHDAERQDYNVMYIGYADNRNGNTIHRLLAHQQKLNGRMWSHFSVFELWDDIQKDDTPVVDQLFHQIYRRDAQYKLQMARDERFDTGENLFVPQELFRSFIARLARTSSQIIDYEESKRTGKTRYRTL